MADFKAYIARAASGTPLSFEEAREAFDVVMSGEATPSQIGGFLMALRVRDVGLEVRHLEQCPIRSSAPVARRQGSS